MGPKRFGCGISQGQPEPQASPDPGAVKGPFGPVGSRLQPASPTTTHKATANVRMRFTLPRLFPSFMQLLLKGVCFCRFMELSPSLYCRCSGLPSCQARPTHSPIAQNLLSGMDTTNGLIFLMSGSPFVRYLSSII